MPPRPFTNVSIEGSVGYVPVPSGFHAMAMPVHEESSCLRASHGLPEKLTISTGLQWLANCICSEPLRAVAIAVRPADRHCASTHRLPVAQLSGAVPRTATEVLRLQSRHRRVLCRYCVRTHAGGDASEPNKLSRGSLTVAAIVRGRDKLGVCSGAAMTRRYPSQSTLQSGTRASGARSKALPCN